MSYLSYHEGTSPVGGGAFQSMTEALDPAPGIVPKTHFVEWFSGDALDSIWTLTDIVGTGSGAMNDATNGGYRITTGGTDDNETSINCNDIRHYSNTASMISIVMVRAATARIRGGFSEDTDMTNSFALIQNDFDDTNYELSTDDGTTETSTASSTAVDTTKRRHDITLSSASIQSRIDGTLEVAKTTNLPDTTQQPFCSVKARSTGAKTGDIQYLEAYST